MKRRTFLGVAALALVPRCTLTGRLVTFGDSITSGMGASVRSRAYAFRVAAWLGRTLDNRAVSSTLCADHVAAIQATTFAPGDLAIWLTGYNDMRAGTAIEEYRTQLAAGIAACPVPLMLGNCLRMTEAGYRDAPGGYGSDARVAEFNAVIAETSAHFSHARLVDACAAYDPACNADLVHPNDAGHQQIAQAFAHPLFIPIWG